MIYIYIYSDNNTHFKFRRPVSRFAQRQRENRSCTKTGSAIWLTLDRRSRQFLDKRIADPLCQSSKQGLFYFFFPGLILRWEKWLSLYRTQGPTEAVDTDTVQTVAIYNFESRDITQCFVQGSAKSSYLPGRQCTVRRIHTHFCPAVVGQP